MILGAALLRVSSDKQFHQGDSIDTQRTRVDMAAVREGADIVRYFVEHFSGRNTDRAVIEELLIFLDENPEIQIVYIAHIDRFTRAGSDTYLYLKKQLLKRGVQLRDAMGTIQKAVNTLEHTGFEYDWSVVSPSRTTEIMQAEHANTEATHILTRTIGQQIKLAGQGYHVRNATIGFRNDKMITSDGRELPIMIPHEIEAPWFIKLFELSAEGQLSDADICERINAMGFKTRRLLKRDRKSLKVIGCKGENSLTPKMLDKYRQKPIYCGVKVEKWTHNEPVKTPFPGLVSIDLFNRANRGKVFIHHDKVGNLSIEYNKAKYRRSPDNSDFLLRHVIHCPHCLKPMMGSYSKNKQGRPFGYYHCSRGHKRYAIPKKEFESVIGYVLKSLELKPGFLGLFKECVREVWLEKHNAVKTEMQVVSNHAAELEAQQDLLIERLTQVTSSVVIKKLEAEIESLETVIRDTKKQKIQYALKMDHIEDYFAFHKNTLEHIDQSVFKSLGRKEIEKIWGFIYSGRPSYEEIISGTPPLALIYRLSRDFKPVKVQMAWYLRQNWNTFETDVKRHWEGYSSSELENFSYVNSAASRIQAKILPISSSV